jgi:catechol 2,3-dioxygenase-like lactoylglutathione lyase family enzyme
MAIQFQSSVIFVRDIQLSRTFYEDLLKQKVAIDFGVNIGFEAGFAIWQVDHAHQIIFGSSGTAGNPLGCRNVELCFEADDLDALQAQAQQAGVRFVHPLLEQPWGQRVFRIYDPDGHMIELGEPMTVVILRLFSEGLSAQETAQKTGMPLKMVEQTLQAGV